MERFFWSLQRHRNDAIESEAVADISGGGNSGGTTVVQPPPAPAGPTPTPNADGVIIVEVRSGDSLWAIAARAGLTLDEAVRVMAKTQLNRDLDSAQVDDLVAFLDALTGEFPQQPLPRLPATSGWSIID